MENRDAAQVVGPFKLEGQVTKGKSVKGGIDVSADVKIPSVDIKKTTSTKPASNINTTTT